MSVKRNSQYIACGKDMLKFIESSPSCFHAVENVKCRLQSEGYTEHFESESWDIKPGGKYFVTRSQSSIIAFRVPNTDYSGFMIAASHSDSPTFRIMEKPVKTGDGYTQLGAERYGGMIYSTWLDRPLSVAGRVFTRSEKGIESRLVCIDRDLVLIPNVAIHMNRDINSGYSYNPAVDLLPLFSAKGSKTELFDIIAKTLKINKQDIISSDLFLYNRQKGSIWGAENEFISAPRIDDLQCVYSTLCGFLAAKDTACIPVLCIFDNEEVGSGTKQGADSTFLYDTLSRINKASGASDEQYHTAIANSLMVSADNAHAVHPNHPEYADKNNRPVMNGGIVIKFNANQRYTTDGISAALFGEICRRADVPTQVYTNRADLPGGSTLGNISSSHISVNCVDIGLAQLAMHSSYETAGIMDTHSMIEAMTVFFSSSINQKGSTWTVK
ncbi:MAG: M18 family aminopeptidase [Clostridia bacterium]|nr:M18 family aminopeptidase [Clostridia bacterium]